MMPVTIRNGYTLLRLSRLQCADLSQVCCFASQEGLGPDLGHWRTLTTLFHCCATAEPPKGRLAPPTTLPPELAYIKPQNEIVILELSIQQCASLTNACWFAGERSPDEDVDPWYILTGLFYACTVAGLAQWQMSPDEIEGLEDELKALGLSLEIAA